MNPKPYKLPKRLSDFILHALDDLEKVEQSKHYAVNMDTWHEPNQNNTCCYVCFAGAVMAKTFHVPRAYSTPSRIPGSRNLLRALNYIRCGALDFALIEIGKSARRFKIPDSIEVTNYAESPSRFKLEMTLLARALREVGL